MTAPQADGFEDIRVVEAALDALSLCHWGECDDPTDGGTSYCVRHIGLARLRAASEQDRDDSDEESFI